MTFAEEYPHLTKIGRFFGRVGFGCVAAFFVGVATLLLGGSEFLAGWFSGLVYMYVVRPVL